MLALSGGVSANARLAERVARLSKAASLKWRVPASELRTDNALMIAYAASHRGEESSPVDLDIHPNFNGSLSAA
jgi:tRNA A37 threonylcarbamoyltransferase TsaD